MDFKRLNQPRNCVLFSRLLKIRVVKFSQVCCLGGELPNIYDMVSVKKTL